MPTRTPTPSSPQFEQLRLQVDLQDDAMAGLQRLQRELNELQRSNRGFMEATRRHTSILGEFTKNLGIELRGVQKSFEGMSQHIGGAAVKAAGLSFMFYNASKGMAEFGTGIRETSRWAEAAGISYSRAVNILDQLSRAGIEGEKGARMIAQIGEAHAEAMRITGSKMFEELRNQIRPDIANEFQRKFASAVKREDQFNAIKEMFEGIETEVRRLNSTRSETYIQEQIALGKRTAARILGVDVEIDHVKSLHELDKKRSDLLETREKNAKAIAEDWDNTMANMKQIKDFFLSDAFRPDRGPARMIHDMRVGTEATYKILQSMESILSGHQLFEYFSMTPSFKAGMDFFNKMIDWARGTGGGKRATVGGHDLGPLVGQPWTPPEEQGNDDLANKLGAGSLSPLKPGGRSLGWQPQRFSGGGEETGQWFGGRLSTNIEDHRRAVTEDTEDRTTNSKLLKQVNEKLFQILNPPGGAGGRGGGGVGLGGGAAGLAAAFRSGGGGGGGGGRGFTSDSGGGSGVRGGGGATGGGGARGTSGDTGYKGSIPQPSAATKGGRYPNIENVKASAKDQLIKEGYTAEQAEIGANALVGQAIAESGLRSQYHDQGKKSGAAGGYVPSIYGADHSRGQAMMKWMKDNNLDPNDTSNQARWMAHEAQQYKGVVAELKKEHPDQGRVADVLTTDFEAPKTRYSPATQAERRRNAQIAAGVGAPKEIQQPTTTTPPATGPQAAAPSPDADKGAGDKVMIGFRGVGGAFDEAAFNAHARALGYRPVVMKSDNIGENNAQASEFIKNNPNSKIALYGFSKGTQAVSTFVQNNPNVKVDKVVTVAPFRSYNLDHLKKYDWDNFPDFSSGKIGPEGSGFKIQTEEHAKKAQQEVVTRLYGQKPEETQQTQQAKKQGDTPAPAEQTGPGVYQGQAGHQRPEAINPRLHGQLGAISGETGVGFDIFSGGEQEHGWHSGSGRHMHGGAADTTMYVMENGKKRYLQADNAEDRAKIQQVIASARRHGVTGIGIGPGYMEGHEGTAIHIGGGHEAHWGAGNSGANSPKWTVDAFEHPDKFPATFAGDTGAKSEPSKLPPTPSHPDYSGHAGAEMDMHKIRTTIDKTSSADKAQIETTGHLKADVIAPPNVKIQMAGTGAFKKTELVRHLTGGAGKIVHPHSDQGAPAPREQVHTAGGPT
jgi:hypothetical protein